MKRKKPFFKRIKQEGRVKTIFFLVSMVVISCLYIVSATWLNNLKMSTCDVNYDVLLYKDIVDVVNNEREFVVSGWIMKGDAKISDVNVVLKAPDGTKKMFKTTLSTSEAGKKYADYWGIESPYRGSGFTAKIRTEEVCKDTSYEILLYVTYVTRQEKKTNLFSTDKYLYNEEILFYKAEQTYFPSFTDRELMDVLNKGTLYWYDKKDGIWVYLFENCLYWIVDKEIERSSQEEIYIIFHRYPFDKNNLSADRREYGFDNLDFYFRDKEILLTQDSEYRVAKVELAETYPITYFSTGRYDTDEKIICWQKNILYLIGDE